MTNAPREGRGALQVTAGQVVTESVPHDPDETENRPRCDVVGVYCEALGWLHREPPSHATVCCRHYWAEAVAS